MIGYGSIRVVYLDNKTSENIKNLCISHGEKTIQNHDIKELKAKPDNASFTRKPVQLIFTHIAESNPLKLYYYDKNNVRHEHIIMERITNQFSDNIGIEILDVKENGELEIKVEHHFKG